MMKPRSSRVTGEQLTAGRQKAEQNVNGPAGQRNQTQTLNNQQTAASTIRKRRSSINVYDQPSSLNSRLRQLETDMLRLDEDRTKLFDDTHTSMTQFDLRLNEIQAILKSRQDNVEKYVEDMKLLLQAKEEFERQTKLLNEKHDRMHEKFMHRETTISREIKLLKNKFEVIEKSRQFRSILNKSNNGHNTSALSGNSTGDTNDDLGNGLDPNESQRAKDDPTGDDVDSVGGHGRHANESSPAASQTGLAAKLSQLNPVGRLFSSVFGFRGSSNRVASLDVSAGLNELHPEYKPTIAVPDSSQSSAAEVSRAPSGSDASALTNSGGQRKRFGGGFFARFFG